MEWNPPSALSLEADDDKVLHTNEDVYRLLRVVFGSVCDLETQVNTLTTSNDKLVKANGEQAATIAILCMTVQQMAT